MSSILVTGGLGFIGSHLVHRLLDHQGANVLVVDDLSGTSMTPDQLLALLKPSQRRRLEVHLGSVEEFRTNKQFSTIFHLASIVGPAAVLTYAGQIVESIVQASYRVIRLAESSGARLINVSTSEVYGGGMNGFCHENTPRVFRGAATARQEYAAGKMAVEVAIENRCKSHNLDAVTVRPFNVAGPRQSGLGGFVLPRFVAQAILNEPLTVFGSGRQVRAFTDVRDVVSALILCAVKGAKGTIYNVGNRNNRVTIDELADCVLQITRSTGGKCHVDPRHLFGADYAEAPDKYPDADRILSLGWQPQFDLTTTITDTFDYMRQLTRKQLIRLAGLPAGRKTRHGLTTFAMHGQEFGVMP